MLSRLTLIALGLGAGLLWSPVANADPGWATGNVNLRTCASTQCQRITTIPAGARVEVYWCSSWCELSYRGILGFASARYIAVGYVQPAPPPPPIYYPPPPPPVYYPAPRTYPWWEHREYRRWNEPHQPSPPSPPPPPANSPPSGPRPCVPGDDPFCPQ